MTNQMQIHAEDGSISVEVIEYERELAENESDANWLVCNAKVVLPTANASMRCTVTTRDFVRFGEQLERAFSSAGSAVFSTDEESITIEIDLKTTGDARISTKLVDFGPPRLRFEVVLTSDHSSLRQTYSDLKSILRAFPVRLT